MKKAIIQIYNTIVYFFRDFSNYALAYGSKRENKRLLKILKSIGADSETKIVDVGCGYGRILNLLKKNNFNCIGVDINPEIVCKNKENGFDCYTAEEFKTICGTYDIMIMNHVIEHHLPHDLLFLFDTYLSSLNNKGVLVVTTPLLTKQFYLDFDHIKPYLPESINMVFKKNVQMQYNYNESINLVKTIYFRVPLTHRTLSFTSYKWGMFAKGFVDLIFFIFFFMSFSLIGVNATWLGVFKKDI